MKNFIARLVVFGWWILFGYTAGAQTLEVLEDPKGNLSIEQILASPDRFELTHQTSFGFSDSTFWLRIQLSNDRPTPSEQAIQLQAVQAPSEIYAYRPTANGIQVLRSGSQVPISERPNAHRLITLPFTLAPYSQETVYLKVRDVFQIHLGHRVVSTSLAQAYNERFVIFSTGIVGALTALLLYNLSIALFSRSRLYAYYCGLLASSLFIFAVDSRQTELVGWLADRALAYPATSLFFVASHLFLATLFKAVQNPLTRLSRRFALALATIHLFLPIEVMIRSMDHYLVLVLLLSLAVEIFHALYKRHPLAWLVALGWSLYTGTILVSILASQGVIAPGWANLYALGSLVEVLVFSTALALRLRLNEKSNHQLIQRLNQTLHIDGLTGLPNRAGIHHWLLQGSHTALGLVLINIDRFKSVNETFSSEQGDRLLRQIAQALKEFIPEDGLVGRLGGDEFLVALSNTSETGFIRSTEQLLRVIRQTRIQHAGQHISRSASAGALQLNPVYSINEALTSADLALLYSKDLGGNQCTHFTAEFEEKMIQRGAYITDVEIETALRAGELKYFVQPIYTANLNGQVIEGFEALIRWIKPNGDLVLPGAFANKFDAIFFKPDHRLIRQRMRQAVFDAVKPFGPVYVSWNFSANQLGQAPFVDCLVEEFHALNAGAVNSIIEISEHRATSNVDHSALIEQLARIQKEGFLVALDDFGVEHSNIDRLTNLPLDIVKLDRSLI